MACAAIVIKGFLVSLVKRQRLWGYKYILLTIYHPLRDFFHPLLGSLVTLNMEHLPVGGTGSFLWTHGNFFGSFQWCHSGAILQLSKLLCRVRSNHLLLPEALREHPEERLELELGVVREIHFEVPWKESWRWHEHFPKHLIHLWIQLRSRDLHHQQLGLK